MKAALLQPFRDMEACLLQLAQAHAGPRQLVVVTVAMVVTWFVYVPIHEMLHVVGCVITGGSVSRLEIAPYYGGFLLERWFPFVVSGGDYAGRLSGFDHHGSDLIYLATDFMPFILSIVLGVPLLRACGRRSRPVLLGAAVVIGLAPFYNLIGDYYEVGSIIVTRVATVVAGGEPIAFEGIRSDDVFLLSKNLIAYPADLGLMSVWETTIACLLAALSLAIGLFLSFVTYWLGSGWSNLVGMRSSKMRK